ncbi:MAG: pyrimidine-nucleoside phosphorylase [Bacilli bacterium]|nr:pyrimidine-nucleoside phosphorylase [Bacilli bacterium]
MRAVDLIIKKKNGQPLSKQEIHYLIKGYVDGSIPDYQISALLMAICFQGLSSEEQLFLTTEMLESGEKIDLSSISGICVDKHSTGGVGDKTTLVVAPIVAACGLKIAKMSGRGLGHTGGTLDKLESIPGYQINVSSAEFLKQVEEIGIAVIGQTANITPADKKLYALRDVTGTIESLGLIAGSIMSKKLASGANSILLDVKVGDGAFMKTIEEARELAQAMVRIGNGFNRRTVAVLTNMDEPLGYMIGNSLEVIEAIETLKGQGPADLKQLCYDLSAELLMMTRIKLTYEEAIQLIEEKVTSGEALQKLYQMIAYQKGNPNVIVDYSLFGTAPYQYNVLANEEGYIKKIATEDIGIAAMLLGAGREKKEDKIDHRVGIKINKKVGDFVEKGESLAVLYANQENSEAENKVKRAFTLQKKKIEKNPIVIDIIR